MIYDKKLWFIMKIYTSVLLTFSIKGICIFLSAHILVWRLSSFSARFFSMETFKFHPFENMSSSIFPRILLFLSLYHDFDNFYKTWISFTWNHRVIIEFITQFNGSMTKHKHQLFVKKMYDAQHFNEYIFRICENLNHLRMKVDKWHFNSKFNDIF